LKLSQQFREENLVASPWQADVLQLPLSLFYAFQRTHQQLTEFMSGDLDSDNQISLDYASVSNIVGSVDANHHSVDAIAVI
jgi:hypothetical protein